MSVFYNFNTNVVNMKKTQKTLKNKGFFENLR